MKVDIQRLRNIKPQITFFIIFQIRIVIQQMFTEHLQKV